LRAAFRIYKTAGIYNIVFGYSYFIEVM